MPNTKSAKKRLRQNVVRRNRNRSVKSAVKTRIRKVRDAIAAGEVDASETEFRQVAKQIDRAAASGVVHANHAARVKSRLSAAIKAAKQK